MGVRPASATRTDLWRMFVLAFVVYAYFMPRWADWNIDSRLDLVHALVDDRTVRIDRTNANTWDKAVYRGHYYSDKAPGTAVLGAGVYAVYLAARRIPPVNVGVKALLRNNAWKVPIQLGEVGTQRAPAPKGTNLGGCQRTGSAGNVQVIPWGNRLVPPFRDWALSKYLVSIFTVSLISALFSVFFLWFISLFTSRPIAIALTGLYAFASVVLPYSTNFYSHQIAAASLFVAYALMFLFRAGNGRSWVPGAAGLLLGFSLFTEYTTAIVVVLVGLYGFMTLRRRRLQSGVFVAGILVPVALVLVYNALCFGRPLDTGYSHDFCWSSAQAAGFAGFTYPHAGPLFDLTFGSFRGLFYLSPFLLLAFPGAALARRRSTALDCVFCLVVAGCFIVALSAYWGWNGGKVEGPRYLVPIVPFLAFPCVFAFDKARSTRGMLVLIVPMALWSMFAVWAEYLGGQLFPVSWWRDPIFQYSLPHLRANDIAPNAGLFLGLTGWQSLLPLVLLCLLISAVPSGRLRSRRPASAGLSGSASLS